MTDRNGNHDVIRVLTRMTEVMQKTNTMLGKLVDSVNALTATTREGYEGPMRLLTEMEEGLETDEPASSLDEDDIDEIDESEAWRLG